MQQSQWCPYMWCKSLNELQRSNKLKSDKEKNGSKHLSFIKPYTLYQMSSIFGSNLSEIIRVKLSWRGNVKVQNPHCSIFFICFAWGAYCWIGTAICSFQKWYTWFADYVLTAYQKSNWWIDYFGNNIWFWHSCNICQGFIAIKVLTKEGCMHIFTRYEQTINKQWYSFLEKTWIHVAYMSTHHIIELLQIECIPIFPGCDVCVKWLMGVSART